MIFPAFIFGLLAGVVLLFLSHIAPMLGAGNFIRDIDQPKLFGRALSFREAHFLGIFVHLVFSGLFAAAYAGLVAVQVFDGFDLLPLMGWGLILSIATGGILLPLEGHGLFGVKEDAWFPVDLVLTNILWSIVFWWMVHLWPI